MEAERLVGKRGWREYRRTSGVMRWAIDREWIKHDGVWRKRGHHRRDVPPLTETQYEQWKSTRTEARERVRNRVATTSDGVREIVVD
jgi:hypothetical protein